MATKKNVNEPAPEQAIENALSNTERFLQDNGKTMLIALAIVVVLVGGFFGYRYLHVMPRQEKAAEAMYVAEQLFAQDDFATALNGDGNNNAAAAYTVGTSPISGTKGTLASTYWLDVTEEETLLYTYHLTDSVYQYHPTWSGNAYHYAYRWAEAAEYQMYMAGVRLAKHLNELF